MWSAWQPRLAITAVICSIDFCHPHWNKIECLSNFNLLFLDDLRVKCFSVICFIFWKFLALFFSIGLFSWCSTFSCYSSYILDTNPLPWVSFLFWILYFFYLEFLLKSVCLLCPLYLAICLFSMVMVFLNKLNCLKFLCVKSDICVPVRSVSLSQLA